MMCSKPTWSILWIALMSTSRGLRFLHVCFVSRNPCATVTLRPFRVKSSGSRSCGGHWKWSATSSTRRFRTSVVHRVEPRELRSLTQGLTRPHRHRRTLCWSPAASQSQTLLPALSLATVTPRRMQPAYLKGRRLHPSLHRNEATQLSVSSHASSVKPPNNKPPACKPLYLLGEAHVKHWSSVNVSVSGKVNLCPPSMLCWIYETMRRLCLICLYIYVHTIAQFI